MIPEEDRGEESTEKEEEEIEFINRRLRLVQGLETLGVGKKVRQAMLRVPRHSFVPEYARSAAYADTPLDIGCGQTISAPHMVAIMCELLELSEGLKVLEIGAGSGYNAAVMAELIGKSGHVYTVERIESLVCFAKDNLRKTGYKNITVLLEDGSIGYSKYAPYDRIVVTCAAPEIPEPLVEQLKPGGIMIIPVGDYFQELILVKKDKKGKIKKENRGGVVFVPLIGEYGFKPR
ncbi:protein-L-isoaspartate O-methyltransferase [Methanosarcina sp. KYL-1]|uniref:protein-L-isoaspartate O-methyltransferase n=1 Tax=Methanosarcina sp. KYL-1 TaxID=2602068 RepID=UPI0021019F8B